MTHDLVMCEYSGPLLNVTFFHWGEGPFFLPHFIVCMLFVADMEWFFIMVRVALMLAPHNTSNVAESSVPGWQASHRLFCCTYW